LRTDAQFPRSIAGGSSRFACIPQRIFPRGPISLIALCLKIGLGAFRQERPPFAFEIGAGLGEGRGGVGLIFARIEAAAPFPPISIVRVAAALGDRTGVPA
jgi:hypothetical protein